MDYVPSMSISFSALDKALLKQAILLTTLSAQYLASQNSYYPSERASLNGFKQFPLHHHGAISRRTQFTLLLLLGNFLLTVRVPAILSF